MKNVRFVMVLIAVLGGLALVATACAPAAEPKPAAQQPSAEKPVAPKPAAEAPKPVAEVPKPVAEVPKPAAEKPAAPKASVSGIPLDPKAKFGGVLRVSYTQEGPTFSMWEEKGGVTSSAGQPMDNGLVRLQTWGTLEDFSKQAYFELHPDLAVSWEQSADGLRWTFKLRDGVKFSDGVPFTCADAKWSLDSVRTGQGLKRSPLAVSFKLVDDIQCPSDLTMVVNLKKPKPGFLEVVGQPNIVVMPKAKYQNNTDELRAKPNVGTGPFVLKQWIPAEKYVYARKADYWDKPLPYLDGIELIFMATAAQATALRAGRIDIGQSGSGFSGGPAETLIKECTQCQAWPKVYAQGPIPAVMVHHQRPPWNNPLIKEAIALAIDKAKVVQLDKKGWNTLPTGGPFYPGSYWAMPYDRVKQIPGYNFETPEENKARARELLKQAGYKPGELTINYGYSPLSGEGQPPIMDDLRLVGFKITSYADENARAYERMTAGEFDVYQHGFWDGGADPDFTLYEQFYTGSDRNYNRYSNPQYDRLVDEMSVTLDREERRRKAWDAAELAFREQAKIWIAFGGNTPVFGSRVRGLMSGPAHNSYGAVKRFDHTWVTGD